MSSDRDPFAASSAAQPVTTTRGQEPLGATSVGATGPADRHARGGDQSIGELFSEVSRDLSTLIRQEVELAKAEAAQTAKRAGKGAGMFGGAGVAGHMVLLFLSLALWWGLSYLMGGGWSALVVAAVWAVIAAVLAARGRSEIKAMEGLPQTADSVKKIPDALRGHEEKNP
ncbi:putative Holin-X, holin superfamily III [Promicromonospora umidemergens]|uniref:phage holin family protein n=1 Tax=Promicromonospora umidemergens TaxID=629679 RepID=UPI0020A3C5B8|nr:phage holin family protein [Promicromonospora umidemergens]MCP2282201.1 putative Holin-X, holin superfamily III [Promicromonospora umidemergens]